MRLPTRRFCRGLSDPDSVPVPVYDTPGLIRLVNVKKLRERLGLTQEVFAATYRIPVGTLRDWEQCRKNRMRRRGHI